MIEEKLKKINYKSPWFISKEIGIPDDYCNFIKNYSGQTLHDTFVLYSYPIDYYEIFGYEIRELNGMYLFASDNSEYLFAFDSKNNWQIFEIDSDGEIFQVVAKTFTEFINNKLDELIEIEESE